MGSGASKAPIGKKVVVVGGGYTGTNVARALDGVATVTLVARQERLVHNIAGLRASVVPGFEQRVLVPLSHVLTNGTVKSGVEVMKVDDQAKTVTLSNGETLVYDALVIATGSLGPKTFGAALVPTAAADIEAVYKQRQAAIAAAKSILIVGGGPVGMETAGEIAAYYKDKKVTLVTSKGLMEDPNSPFSDKFKTALKRKLESVGVKVVLNAGRVTLGEANNAGLVIGANKYSWTGGEGDFDLAIPALGSRQVPAFIAASGWDDKLDNGLLKVDANLQVQGTPPGTVWAVGDSNNVKETKLSYYGGVQAALVVKNIKAAATGKPQSAYTAHTSATSLVPVGPSHGAAEIGGRVLGDFLCKQIKSKDLFVSQTWGGVGAKAELAALK